MYFILHAAAGMKSLDSPALPCTVNCIKPELLAAENTTNLDAGTENLGEEQLTFSAF